MRIARLSAFASLAILAACAGFEPAGRSTSAALPPPAPAPAVQAPAAAPPVRQIAPTVTLPTPAAPAPRPAADNEVVIPGTREEQVRAPNGDPRTESQRMADINAWDRCVTRVHNRGEDDPLKPQMDDPEATCRRALGMASRTAVPASRQP